MHGLKGCNAHFAVSNEFLFLTISRITVVLLVFFLLKAYCNSPLGLRGITSRPTSQFTCNPGVKMLVSPPILAATKEPILTAFSVSNKLYILAKRREEYRDIYSSLAQEVFVCLFLF